MKPVLHRCKVAGCRDVGADVLCPTHRNMQATIRAAQRGPVPKAAVDAFLDALARGYGEGEGTPGRYLERQAAQVPTRTRKRAS